MRTICRLKTSFQNDFDTFNLSSNIINTQQKNTVTVQRMLSQENQSQNTSKRKGCARSITFNYRDYIKQSKISSSPFPVEYENNNVNNNITNHSSDDDDFEDTFDIIDDIDNINDDTDNNENIHKNNYKIKINECHITLNNISSTINNDNNRNTFYNNNDNIVKNNSLSYKPIFKNITYNNNNMCTNMNSELISPCNKIHIQSKNNNKENCNNTSIINFDENKGNINRNILFFSQESQYNPNISGYNDVDDNYNNNCNDLNSSFICDNIQCTTSQSNANYNCSSNHMEKSHHISSDRNNSNVFSNVSCTEKNVLCSPSKLSVSRSPSKLCLVSPAESAISMNDVVKFDGLTKKTHFKSPKKKCFSPQKSFFIYPAKSKFPSTMDLSYDQSCAQRSINQRRRSRLSLSCIRTDHKQSESDNEDDYLSDDGNINDKSFLTPTDTKKKSQPIIAYLNADGYVRDRTNIIYISCNDVVHMLQQKYITNNNNSRNISNFFFNNRTVGSSNNNNNNKFHDFSLIDCRYSHEYNGGHVKTALHLPARESIDKLFSTNKDTKNATFVFYCELSRCRGPRAAEYFDFLFRTYTTIRDTITINVMTDGYRSFWKEPKDRENRSNWMIPVGYTPENSNLVKKREAKSKYTRGWNLLDKNDLSWRQNDME